MDGGGESPSRNHAPTEMDPRKRSGVWNRGGGSPLEKKQSGFELHLRKRTNQSENKSPKHIPKSDRRGTKERDS